jgi:hypothetical protein
MIKSRKHSYEPQLVSDVRFSEKWKIRQNRNLLVVIYLPMSLVKIKNSSLLAGRSQPNTKTLWLW